MINIQYFSAAVGIDVSLVNRCEVVFENGVSHFVDDARAESLINQIFRVRADNSLVTVGFLRTNSLTFIITPASGLFMRPRDLSSQSFKSVRLSDFKENWTATDLQTVLLKLCCEDPAAGASMGPSYFDFRIRMSDGNVVDNVVEGVVRGQAVDGTHINAGGNFGIQLFYQGTAIPADLTGFTTMIGNGRSYGTFAPINGNHAAFTVHGQIFTPSLGTLGWIPMVQSLTRYYTGAPGFAMINQDSAIDLPDLPVLATLNQWSWPGLTAVAGEETNIIPVRIDSDDGSASFPAFTIESTTPVAIDGGTAGLIQATFIYTGFLNADWLANLTLEGRIYFNNIPFF